MVGSSSFFWGSKNRSFVYSGLSASKKLSKALIFRLWDTDNRGFKTIPERLHSKNHGRVTLIDFGWFSVEPLLTDQSKWWTCYRPIDSRIDSRMLKWNICTNHSYSYGSFPFHRQLMITFELWLLLTERIPTCMCFFPSSQLFVDSNQQSALEAKKNINIWRVLFFLPSE